jgi:hypothetical protein
MKGLADRKMSIDFEGMYRKARAEATDVAEHTLQYLDTVKDPLWRIQLLGLLSPRMRAVTQERAKRQEEVMRVVVLTALPYGQVDAALKAAGLDPRSLYDDLAAGYETPQLERFAETLKVPLKRLAPMGRK